MYQNLTKEENMSKEQLLKELKVNKAQLAVLELEKEARKKAEQETELLKKLILSISEGTDLNSALELALKNVCNLTGWCLGQAWLPSTDVKNLVFSVGYGNISGLEDFRKLSEDCKFLPGEGLPGRSWKSKTPSWVKDVTEDSNFSRSQVASMIGLKAGFAVPIVADDVVVAVIEFFMMEPKEEDIHQVSLVSAVATQVGILIQRKKIEDEYKKAQERFTGIFNSSKDAIDYVTIDGVLLDVNDSFLNLTGYTREELVGKKKYQELTPLEYHEFEEKIIENILKTGESVEYEKEYIKKDGSRVSILLTAFLIKDEKGEPIGFAAVIKDISERKRIENELKLLNESLEKKIKERTNDLVLFNKELRTKIRAHRQALDVMKEQEAGFRLLFAHNPNPMLVCDLNTLEILEINQMAINSYGYTRDEFLKMKITDIRPPEDVPKLLEHLKKERISVQYSGQWRHLKKDGTVFDVEITSHTLEYAGKKAILIIAKDISKQKYSETLVKESEQRYKRLIETANDAIFVADVETGVIVDVNKQAERLLGYSKEKIIGMHQTELHPKEESEYYAELFKNSIKDQNFISQKLFVINKDGQKIPVEISASVTEVNGKKLIQGIFRDLSRWEQVERTRSQLTAIVKYSADGIIGTTLEGIVFSWNPGAEKIYGYTADEIMGKHVSKLFHPDSMPEIPMIIERISKGESIEQHEGLRLRKDGKQICVSIDIAPIRDNDGKITGISSIVHDITKRKKSEDKLLQFASLIESSDDAIMGKTLDGIIVSWNPAAERIYGYAAEEILGKHFSVLIPKDEAREVENTFEKIKNGESVEHYETIRLRKDGKKVFVSLTISPVKDTEGKVVGISAIARDITEQHKLKIELEKAKQREQHEKEIRKLEALTSTPGKSDVTTKLFGLIPLKKSLPGIFNNFVDHYENLLDKLFSDEDGIKEMVSEELSYIAEELTKLRAGPYDIMEIHNKVLKRKESDLSLPKLQEYSERARFILLELMSNTISSYRKSSLIIKEAGSAKSVLKV